MSASDDRLAPILQRLNETLSELNQLLREQKQESNREALRGACDNRNRSGDGATSCREVGQDTSSSAACLAPPGTEGHNSAEQPIKGTVVLAIRWFARHRSREALESVTLSFMHEYLGLDKNFTSRWPQKLTYNLRVQVKIGNTVCEDTIIGHMGVKSGHLFTLMASDKVSSLRRQIWGSDPDNFDIARFESECPDSFYIVSDKDRGYETVVEMPREWLSLQHPSVGGCRLDPSLLFGQYESIKQCSLGQYLRISTGCKSLVSLSSLLQLLSWLQCSPYSSPNGTSLFPNEELGEWPVEFNDFCYQSIFDHATHDEHLSTSDHPGPVVESQLVRVPEAASVAAIFAGISLRYWRPANQDKSRSEVGICVKRQSAKLQGFRHPEFYRESKTGLFLKLYLHPDLSLHSILLFNDSYPNNNDLPWDLHSCWNDSGFRPSGSLSGVSVFLALTLAQLEVCFTSWTRNFASIEDRIGLRISASLVPEEWNKFMFDEAFVLSTACFTAVQMMRTAEVWINETATHVAQLKEKLNQTLQSKEYFDQDEFKSVMMNMEIISNKLYNMTSLREASRGMSLNRAIYAFTVVTIIYTPVAFMATFWAMPIFDTSSGPDASSERQTPRGFKETFIAVPVATYVVCLMTMWYFGSATAPAWAKQGLRVLQDQWEPVRFTYNHPRTVLCQLRDVVSGISARDLWFEFWFALRHVHAPRIMRRAQEHASFTWKRGSGSARVPPN